MIDIEKAQQHYGNLAAFAADVTMWADAAGGEEEAMLEPMRQLANRLTSKWRKLIAEACLRERMVVVVDTEAPTPTPAKAKGKGRVEVLTEEEDG